MNKRQAKKRVKRKYHMIVYPAGKRPRDVDAFYALFYKTLNEAFERAFVYGLEKR